MLREDTGKIDRILDYLYLSGKKGAKNRAMLTERNIRHIINITPPRSVDDVAGCPNYFESDKGFSYLRIPIFDTISENIEQHMDKCVDFIAKVSGQCAG